MQLILKFNGKEYKKRPKSEDSIKEAILSVKPELLMTEMYVTLKENGHIRERLLTLFNGRQLFNSDDYLDVFVMNLIMK